MKKSTITIMVLMFTAGTLMTNCNNPTEKTESVKEDNQNALTDLEKTNEVYLVELEAYRKETSNKISANELLIANLNATAEGVKKDAKVEYKKRVSELEESNKAMKKEIDGYKAEGKDSWEKFKAEFNGQMEKFGHKLDTLNIFLKSI